MSHESPIPPMAASPFTMDTAPPVSRLSEQLPRASVSLSQHNVDAKGFRAGIGLQGIARRTLGIILLLITVFLWTASNFLASYIFADDTYSKPYFVTYVNTSCFAISLIPICLRLAHREGYQGVRSSALQCWQEVVEKYRGGSRSRGYGPLDNGLDSGSVSSNARLLAEEEMVESHEPTKSDDPSAVLSFKETAILSFEFCLLWFAANYFVAACLSYTSVASSTILTSTSSIWTLIFGAIAGVEKFNFKKLTGVTASLIGVALISSIDLSGDNDSNRGNFPHKSRDEIAIGDAMAFFSAVMYGIYTVVMKKRIGNEDRVNMPLFFGLVGLMNVVFLWPGFFILHWTDIETFELPPTGKIWTIVLVNSISSFISDYCWAYAMLLTTPLVVTVGISLSIPLSLIGQMLISDQYSSALYWAGAVVVFLSFVFINHESRDAEADGELQSQGGRE